MDRKKFFKILGGTAATAIIYPKILTETPPEKVTPANLDPFTPGVWKEWYDKYGKDFNLSDFIQTNLELLNI